MLIGIDASRANRVHKSGTEWYSYYLIKELARLDKVNRYILYTDEPLRQDLVNLVKTEYKEHDPDNVIEYDRDGFQVIKSPHNNFRAKVLKWPFKYLWTQGRLSIEMIFSRPDVLFVPSHTLPLIHPRKSIVTIHGIGFGHNRRLYEKSRMGPTGWKSRTLLDFLVRLFTRGRFGANSDDYSIWSTIHGLRHAKKIITVSNFSKKEIIEAFGLERGLRGKLEDKIAVIYNGYDKKFRRLEADAEKKRQQLYKYGIEAPFIFYVGRLERKKNLTGLLEAFELMIERNKDIKHKLVLAGDASFGYDEIKYMINQYNLDDRVRKTGWIEEDDLPLIYNSADAFVYPSLHQEFGIALLQAMACGIPIAASNAASIPEVAGDAAIYFNPNDVDSISNSLELICTDSDLRKRLVEKGEQRVKNFSWEISAGRTLELINQL
jgi:glycosyltransferase involved in cell wall biosynthesis